MLKNINNIKNVFLSNMMPGATPHSICTCGYESNDFFSRPKKCPNCETIISNSSTIIKFDYIDFFSNNIFYSNMNDKDLYRFNIVIAKRNGKYKINFSKKSIYKIDIEDNQCYSIIFDAHVKTKEEAVKFYDIINDVYMDENTFLDKISDIAIPHKGIDNCSTRRGNKINLYECYRFKSNKSFLNHLYELANWCFYAPHEILIKAGIDPQEIPVIDINPNGTSPAEILGVKKYTVKQILKYNQSVNTFRTLKNLENQLGDKSVPYMDKFVSKNPDLWLNSNTSDKVINLINNANLSVEKLYRYVYKDVRIQQSLYNASHVISYLSDSFDMCQQLNLVFDKAPKALVRYHDTLSKEIGVIENKENDDKIRKVASKYSHLNKLSELNEENKPIEKYSILLPSSAQDIILEGKVMKHCVGSYVSKMACEQCIILFLRASSFLNKSYVTIEYNPSSNSVVQIKGIGNSKVDSEVIDFINKWGKEKQVYISKIY